MKKIVAVLFVVSSFVVAKPPPPEGGRGHTERGGSATPGHSHSEPGRGIHLQMENSQPRSTGNEPVRPVPPSITFANLQGLANLIPKDPSMVEIALVRRGSLAIHPDQTYFEITEIRNGQRRTRQIRYETDPRWARDRLAALTPERIALLNERTVIWRPEAIDRAPNRATLEAYLADIKEPLRRLAVEAASQVPEARQSPTLRRILENPEYLRSVEFEKRGNDVVAKIRHAGIDREIEIAGTNHLMEILWNGNLRTSLHPEYLASQAPTFFRSNPNLRNAGIGDRVIAARLITEAVARHRAGISGSDLLYSDYTHSITIDRQTGLPSPTGVRIPVEARVVGRGRDPEQIEFSPHDTDNYSGLSPAARETFNLYVRSLNLNPP